MTTLQAFWDCLLSVCLGSIPFQPATLKLKSHTVSTMSNLAQTSVAGLPQGTLLSWASFQMRLFGVEQHEDWFLQTRTFATK
jgi:hypothetical protein